MIDGSEKRNRQLAFELQNLHVCEKRSNMSHRKRVRTLESFFARNRSQSESEKNDTEEEEYSNLLGEFSPLLLPNTCMQVPFTVLFIHFP